MKKTFLLAFVLSLIFASAAFSESTSEILLKRAAGGDAEACYTLGMMYNEGKGFPQDYKKAAEWYEKAAVSGDVRSEYLLGLLHIGGQLGSRNYEKAVKCFESAAFKGHEVAMCKLGMMYFGGVGISQDWVEAYSYLSVAAANGAKKAVKDRDRALAKLSKDQLGEAEKKIAGIMKKLEENKKTKK